MSKMELVEEYPLPFEEKEIIEIQKESLDSPYGLTDAGQIIRSVDEFHEKYIEELTRTGEWVFFRNHWLGCNYIYVWNHQLGYGMKFDSDWEVACSFVEAWDQFTDEYSSNDFEPSHYSWELP